jgi:hypothetical protein
MDSEASVILRRPATATKVAARTVTAVEAMVPSRTSRTESTAVFVGRASFRMIPVVHAARGPQAQVEVEAPARAPVEVEAPARALPATPGPTVITLDDAHAGTKASDGSPGGMVMRLFSEADVTEPIQARPRAVEARRRLVTGRTVRTVLLALFAGATITLSAEAVMRRPATITTVRTPRPSPLPRPAAAAVALPVAVPAPVPAVATVVASTATAPPQEPAPSTLDPSPARVPSFARALRKRARASTTRPSAIATPPVAKTFATWVDPFAAPEATAGATAVTKRDVATAWVDPFAN